MNRFIERRNFWYFLMFSRVAGRLFGIPVGEKAFSDLNMCSSEICMPKNLRLKI